MMLSISTVGLLPLLSFRYFVTAETWVQVARLTPSDGVAQDKFGERVVCDENYMAIGSRALDKQDGVPGYIYIFEKDLASGEWKEMQKIVMEGDRDIMFGSVMAFSKGTLAVGTPLLYQLENIRYHERGGVHIYEAEGEGTENKRFVRKQLVQDTSRGFGSGVAIQDDILLIGYSGCCSSYGSGRVDVYRKSSGSWTFETRISVPTSNFDVRNFGERVAISGNTMVVAEENYDFHIIEWDGSSWTSTFNGRPCNPGLQELSSIAIAGNTVAAGCPESSRVSLYERNDAGSWAWVQDAIPSDGATQWWYGYSVSLKDENTLAVGHNPSNAYIFVRNANRWVQQQKISIGTADAQRYFGWSVSFWKNYFVVGSPGEDNEIGAMYVFEEVAPPPTNSPTSQPTNSPTTTMPTNQPIPNTSEEDDTKKKKNNNDDGEGMDAVFRGLIGAAAGIGTFLIFLALFCLCQKCILSRNANSDKMKEKKVYSQKLEEVDTTEYPNSP